MSETVTIHRVTTLNANTYENLRVTHNTDAPPPTPVITINGECISTPGNITTVSGAPKGGKTAFCSAVEAGAISIGQSIDGIEGVEVQPNPSRYAVLHFDTEQAIHKHKQNLCTVLKRAGLTECPPYYYSYNLRTLDLPEYTTATRTLCEQAHNERGGTHLIVLDGLADYIADVNDPEASNAIIKWAEKLAIDFVCPVLVIIHTNPNSDKERGHLGSQAQRKSESVIQIKKEGDISFIEPKFLRNGGTDSPTIQFSYDRTKGYHVGCGVRVQQATKDVQRLSIINDVVNHVFGGQKSYTYKDAIEKIMQFTLKSEVPAKGIFKELKAHEKIKKDGEYWRSV